MNKELKKEIKEIDEIVYIDKNRLDDEAERQPGLVWEVGKKLANALFDLDEKTADLKVVEADVDAMVREDPEAFDLDKLTEPAIKRAILRSREYKDAVKALNEAKYEVVLFEKASTMLDHRRTSMSILNTQDERNYFVRSKESSRKDFRSHKKGRRK